VDGLSPPDVSGEDLRTLVGRILGWQHLRSTLFDVTRTASGFRFTGHGAGHGVGLCVLGAANLARSGTSADAILRRYYPGLSVQSLSAPPSSDGITIVLPQEDARHGADVQHLATRVVQELRTRLGVATSPPFAIRFHPTVESYQRATGQPWFTSGTTRGAEIHLLPLTILTRRGVVESTLRHEVVHVLTASSLDDAPRWVHEGVAEWAAHSDGDREPLQGQPLICPSNDEFRTATSAAALRRLYARSAACYARDVAAGRTWSARGR
jgi:hypothetical protein